MLVLLPIHPALHDFYLDVDGQNIQREFFDFIRELEKQYQVATWDATKLLPATQFSDALHPNADGRRSYSTAFGQMVETGIDSRPGTSTNRVTRCCSKRLNLCC